MFYRELWSTNGIEAGDLKTIELGSLPTIDRVQLKEVLSSSLPITNEFALAAWSQRTSGSSGVSVEIRMTRAERLRILSYILAAYHLAGMSVRDLNVTIKDPVDINRKNYLQYFGLYRHQYYSIYDPILENASQILQRNKSIKILKSMPSDLGSLAHTISTLPLSDFPKVERIFSDSEHLDKGLRNYLNSIFECPIFDFYSSTEFGVAAFAGFFSEKHNGRYLVSDNSVHLSFEKRPEISGDDTYDIIGTSLINRTTPIIRYQIGDLAYGVGAQFSAIDSPADGSQPAALSIPSGESHTSPKHLQNTSFSGVYGKYLDFLLDTRGGVVSSHTLKQDLTNFPGVAAFKVRQNRDLTLDVALEATNGWNGDSSLVAVRDLINSRFLFPPPLSLRYSEGLRVKRDVRKFKVVESIAAQEFLSGKKQPPSGRN